MPASSRIARLQQLGTLAIAGAGAWWLAAHWEPAPGAAIAGALVIWFGYAIVLAIEFAVLAFVGRRDAAPRPTPGALVRAWLAETWLNAVVFAWRQPFRWNAIPDHLPASASGRRGVVLVHGFVCNRGLWLPWMAELRGRGIPFVAVNLEPVFGSIDDYAAIIDAAVARVTQAT
ncbi:MAG TPA: permease, partial [Telluria sp.]|nr:permease [Telluria sp.]